MHTYMYHDVKNVYYMHHSASKLISIIIINIIIDVKNKKLLLNSITVTAKSI